MNDILAAIETHLGRRLAATQLDYYQVIGLEPFCDDSAKIEKALQEAAQALRQSEQSSESNKASDAKNQAESKQVVNKLLRQAQAILLNPAKKTAYDSQLKRLFETKKSAVTAATAGGLSNRSSVKTTQVAEKGGINKPHPNADLLLPPGDPMKPYTASEPTTAHASFSTTLADIWDVQKRRTELLELFPSLILATAQEEPKKSDEDELWDDLNKSLRPSGRSAGGRRGSVATKIAGVDDDDRRGSRFQSQDSSEEPSEQDHLTRFRKQRQKRTLLTVGGMILAAVGLLGFASYRFVSNRMELAKLEQSKKDEATTNSNTSKGEEQSSKAPRDGVMAGPGKGGRKTPKQDPNLPALPSVRKGNEAGAMPEAQSNPEMNSPPPTPPLPTPQNSTTPPASPTNQPEGMKPEGTKSENPPPSPPVMTKESPEWNKSMNQARELLFQGDIAKFETMMGPAIANAMTPEGKEKALRLDQLGQLYKIYVDGFPEARRKARGASTLKVGNNEISIVEATPEKIIVRSLGKNQTYEWDKLPFGIAAALSDLALSDTAPVDLAARAVYFSIHPTYREAAKSNDLVSKRIQGWFDKSLGKESVRADLKQALTETYE